MLEGELCVDANDACCCDGEAELVEVSGPACRINFAMGDAAQLTLELTTRDGSTVLPRWGSAAECPASGGWWVSSSTDILVIELCAETCSLRRAEPTMLRVLLGCPATLC